MCFAQRDGLHNLCASAGIATQCRDKTPERDFDSETPPPKTIRVELESLSGKGYVAVRYRSLLWLLLLL
jgi:hypothetical protein